MEPISSIFTSQPPPEEPMESSLRRAYLSPPAEAGSDRMEALLSCLADRLAGPLPPRPRHRRI